MERNGTVPSPYCRRSVRDVAPRAMHGLFEGFRDNDLGTLASAMAFQVLTAIAPLLLAVLGAVGFLGLTDLWREHVRPHVADSVSAPVLQIVDDTVAKIIDAHQLFWVTGGALLAAWQLSGAVRTAMGAMNAIYCHDEDRSWKQRYGLSIWLAVVLALVSIAATAEVTLVPLLLGKSPAVVAALLFVVRWLIAGLLVASGFALLVHHAPDRPQPWHYTGAGSVLITVSWLVTSGCFLFYLRYIASYGSIFGNLASLVVVLAFLYLSALTFLFGVQLDQLLHSRGEVGVAECPEPTAARATSVRQDPSPSLRA